MTVVTTEQMIFMAEQHLIAGRFGQAEGLARHVLMTAPTNVSALRTAAIALVKSGRMTQAIPFLRSALKQNPNELDLRTQLGLALASNGEDEEAIGIFRSLIDTSPTDLEPWIRIVSLLRKHQRLHEAQMILDRAVVQWPSTPEFHFYLGLIAADQERFDDAITEYRQAITLRKTLAEAHANLGIVLKAKGLIDEAIASYRTAIALNLPIPDVHCNLGVALFDKKDFDGAIASYQRAIAIDPNFANAHYNLGNALRSERRHEEAIQSYMNAIKVAPHFLQAFSNMAMSLNELGQHDMALRAYDRAIEIQPTWAEPRWNRTLTYLLLGDFVKGWSEFDRRNELNPPSSRTFPGPRWDGQRIQGRTILLNYEMGFGDAIHFVRYVPMVAERVSRVVVECQPELNELFHSIAGASEVITLTKDGVSPKYAVQCSLMRLPQLFNSDERTMPKDVPYLSPSAARVERWAARLGQKQRKRVGLVWAGSPLHQNDRERSIRLSMLNELADNRVDFISLQRGPALEQLSQPPRGMRVLDIANEFENLADTAGMMANLDLVIAVDTALAHLAGATGTAVWVLTPFVPDWRWLLNRTDTPWYPTMKLFRQTRLHDWSDPIAKMVQEFKEWLK